MHSFATLITQSVQEKSLKISLSDIDWQPIWDTAIAAGATIQMEPTLMPANPDGTQDPNLYGVGVLDWDTPIGTFKIVFSLRRTIIGHIKILFGPKDSQNLSKHAILDWIASLNEDTTDDIPAPQSTAQNLLPAMA